MKLTYDSPPRPPCPGKPGKGWVWASLGGGRYAWVKVLPEKRR